MGSTSPNTDSGGRLWNPIHGAMAIVAHTDGAGNTGDVPRPCPVGIGGAVDDDVERAERGERGEHGRIAAVESCAERDVVRRVVPADAVEDAAPVSGRAKRSGPVPVRADR